MLYDVIIVWWWASGLFCSLFLPKEFKKCIIEKTDKLGFKVLLSGWERCNVSNINFDSQFHYIWQSLKSLPGLFHQFGPEDMITYLTDNGIETKIEENGRVILKSGKAKQLVDFLVEASKKNETNHFLSHDVISLMIDDNRHFVITTSTETYITKQIIIATWWLTYPQIGSSPFAYETAQQLWLSLVSPHGALCGIETKGGFPLLSWNTIQAKITLYAKNKVVFTKQWSLLFTHRGLSGPVIFDATLFVDGDVSQYILQCDFDLSSTSKKVVQFFKLMYWDTIRDISITQLRPITEAKVSVWGILLKELDQNFQSKKHPWLYFIGESLDITWKTWWYNLQRAWTSAYVCAKSFMKKTD